MFAPLTALRASLSASSIRSTQWYGICWLILPASSMNLGERGASLHYHDPYVPSLPDYGLKSTPVEQADAVVLVTAHPGIDHSAIAEGAKLFVDLRGATRGSEAQNLVRL
jgi:UDP-N-acetyl-D-mannosaminuronate dehydrogenase